MNSSLIARKVNWAKRTIDMLISAGDSPSEQWRLRMGSGVSPQRVLLEVELSPSHADMSSLTPGMLGRAGVVAVIACGSGIALAGQSEKPLMEQHMHLLESALKSLSANLNMSN